MAILKKKMAGKPAMKKAQNGGETPRRNPGVLVKGAVKDTLQNNVGGKSPELREVVKRETGAERLKKFYKRDYFGADSAKTNTGKNLRKAANTVAKVAYTPHALLETVLLAGSTARANKRDAKAAAASDSTATKRKMGGKIAKKVAPKMMMKKMSKKK
jgi:hypothetical protein